MSVYLINFLVYSMAMVGLLFVCLMVYKKTMVDKRFGRNESDLCIENALNLSQRKTLYVVKAGGEKFLIASDVERTSFLAKLEGKKDSGETQQSLVQPVQAKAPAQEKPVDYSEVMSAIKTTSTKKPMMREILKKLDAQSELNRQRIAHQARK